MVHEPDINICGVSNAFINIYIEQCVLEVLDGFFL